MGNAAAYTAASAMNSITPIVSGFMSSRSGNSEAKMMEQQANIALQESRVRAAQKAQDVSKFQSAQAHAYATSGVTLQGTPAQVLEETRAKGQQEVDALIAQGRAQSMLMKQKAASIRSQGRASMFSGIFEGVGKGIGAYYNGTRVGLYGGKSNSGAPPVPTGPVSPGGYGYDPLAPITY